MQSTAAQHSETRDMRNPARANRSGVVMGWKYSCYFEKADIHIVRCNSLVPTHSGCSSTGPRSTAMPLKQTLARGLGNRGFWPAPAICRSTRANSQRIRISLVRRKLDFHTSHYHQNAFRNKMSDKYGIDIRNGGSIIPTVGNQRGAG